ncbi:MAG TPA: hypothetical protein VN519_06400 [Bryobacteraceae bacterium]|nr:hypothetical protein [Bryobacteraceae bacterium]
MRNYPDELQRAANVFAAALDHLWSCPESEEPKAFANAEKAEDELHRILDYRYKTRMDKKVKS